MSGHEVMTALREHPLTSEAAVVVTSVLDRHDQLALGPDAVLPKPFTRGDVRAVLRGLGLSADGTHRTAEEDRDA